MSYDVSLTIDTGGEEPTEVCDIGNYTSNVAEMWREALGEWLSEMDGRVAKDCIDQLARAVADMEMRPGFYAKYNPPNGWGNVESAREFLDSILTACRRNPKATLRIG